MGRGGSRVLRALFGAFLFVGAIWFLSVEISAHHATTMTARTRVVSKGKYEHWEVIGRGRRHHNHHHSDLNFVIKRRVPNGPDPIHNRRASQARRPPGRT
ncbi:CLAVATA3/ESR (CLE)-related protein 25 [Euphorbia lathyris]|uniref:CLAVATA3/ESR (CLE)-related protein 25 n=1 Tax=Euphorbia lathyris TaxID=212925 RepID=UPI003313E9BF